ITSFTAVSNVRSQAVMRRLGMTHAPADDFDHPGLPAGHPLRRHVLYRIDTPAWRAHRSGVRPTPSAPSKTSLPT
ncbi:MAG: GNAT family protein, partial [Actinomycetota bacterium]|nr:GNAT family protein [Actinomycetota bacterium]